MPAEAEESIRRSIEKAFAASFTACPVVMTGQRPDFAEQAQAFLSISSIAWQPSRAAVSHGKVQVAVYLIAPIGSTPHAALANAGAARAVISRVDIEVKSYPDEEPTSLGYVRLLDATIRELPITHAHARGGAEVPVLQVAVEVEGYVHLA